MSVWWLIAGCACWVISASLFLRWNDLRKQDHYACKDGHY